MGQYTIPNTLTVAGECGANVKIVRLTFIATRQCKDPVQRLGQSTILFWVG